MTDGLEQYHKLERDLEGVTNANCIWSRSCRGQRHFRLTAIASAANKRRFNLQGAEDLTLTFQVGFPKMKWAEENPQIMFDLEALFYPFYKSSTNSSLIMSLYKFHLRLSKPLVLNHCLFYRFFILRICHYCQTFFCSRTSNIKQPSCS